MIQLYNEDCLPAMRGMKDNEFDLAIVDPPYGIGDFNPDKWTHKTTKERIPKKYKYKTQESHWNNNIPNQEYFNEVIRVSKNQIIWGANYYNCFTNKGGAIVWNKENPNPNISTCEIASNSFYKKVDYFKYGPISGKFYSAYVPYFNQGVVPG